MNIKQVADEKLLVVTYAPSSPSPHKIQSPEASLLYSPRTQNVHQNTVATIKENELKRGNLHMYAEVHSNDYYGTKYYKTCKNMGEHAIGENQNRFTTSEKTLKEKRSSWPMPIACATTTPLFRAGFSTKSLQHCSPWFGSRYLASQPCLRQEPMWDFPSTRSKPA